MVRETISELPGTFGPDQVIQDLRKYFGNSIAFHWCIRRKPDSGVPTAGQVYGYYGLYENPENAEKKREEIAKWIAWNASDWKINEASLQEYMDTTEVVFLDDGDKYHNHYPSQKIRHGVHDVLFFEKSYELDILSILTHGSLLNKPDARTWLGF